MTGTPDPHLDRDGFVARYEAELLQIAGEGGWNNPDGRSFDEDRIEGAVAYANREVEGYVRGRYPAGVNSPLLTDYAIDIARYRLRSETNNATVSDEVRRRYDDAMKALRDVQSGKKALIGDDGLALGTADGHGGTVNASVLTTTMPAERAPSVLEGYR